MPPFVDSMTGLELAATHVSLGGNCDSAHALSMTGLELAAPGVPCLVTLSAVKGLARDASLRSA